jgi:phosphotransferase system HPr (HPr) family protein
LLLAAAQGSSVNIKCEGEDEQQAIEAIEQLFADRFDEDS